jgi:hypothetical protein
VCWRYDVDVDSDVDVVDSDVDVVDSDVDVDISNVFFSQSLQLLPFLASILQALLTNLAQSWLVVSCTTKHTQVIMQSDHNCEVGLGYMIH